MKNSPLSPRGASVMGRMSTDEWHGHRVQHDLPEPSSRTTLSSIPGSNLPTVPAICASSSLWEMTLGLASVIPYHCVTTQSSFLAIISAILCFSGAAAFIIACTDEKSAFETAGLRKNSRAMGGTTFMCVTGRIESAWQKRVTEKNGHRLSVMKTYFDLFVSL